MARKPKALVEREKTVLNLTDTDTNKEPQYHYFTCVLYEEDPLHCIMKDYLFNEFDCIGILHDKDVYDEDDIVDDNSEHVVGEIKKPHFHVIWKVHNHKRESTVRKFFMNWYKVGGKGGINGVKDIHSAVLYLMHRTPDSWSKTRYDAESLEYNSSTYVKYITQNAYFIQFGEMLDLLQSATESGAKSLIEISAYFMEQGPVYYEWLVGHQQYVNQVVRDAQFKSRYGGGYNYDKR